MKELHLVCNSHIDTAWLWTTPEGVAAALATFRSAADMAERYDYIFCHNESFLYEKIERIDPQLFSRIKKLVKKGRWHIMGGWYIQPDCLMCGGETYVRHIRYGKRYFKEKFGVTPRIALNLDSFGHSAGLVQILVKSGYDGYLVCRPHFDMFPSKNDYFIWRGLDGSSIKTVRDKFHYASAYGKAGEKILKTVDFCDKTGKENGICALGRGQSRRRAVRKGFVGY